jgi:ABC-2 type transport system permease protein
LNIRYILSHGWYTGIVSIRSTYYYIIANLCLPLSLLFIVGVLSQGRLLPYALAGGIISMMAMNSIQSAGELTQFRLDSMHQDLIIATKTGPLDYMFGEMLGSLGWSIPSVLLYIALDTYYHLLTPYNLGMTIIVCLLVTVATLSLTFSLFSFVKYVRKSWALSTILSTLMTVITPVFYPYPYIPKSLLIALTFLPVTPAAVLEQGLFKLAPMSWYMLLVLLVETVVYLFIARYIAKWRES